LTLFTQFALLVLLLTAAAAGITIYRLWSINRQLRQNLDNLNKLLDASIKLNSIIHDQEELLSSVMLTAANVIGAEAASIILKDEESNELFFKVATGEKGDEVKEIRLQMGEGIAGWVAKTGKPIKIDEVESDKRWSRRVSDKVQLKTRNLACVPIKTKTGVIGVLQAINKIGQQHFNEQDMKLLEAITLPTGVALENARLYSRLQQKQAQTPDSEPLHA
jgi:GAF domain-containing protein